MKYGIQITETDDGAYAVTQLEKRDGEREFTNTGKTHFVEKAPDGSMDLNLIMTAAKGLHGQIRETRTVRLSETVDA
jgi:hypothetical protein